MINPSDKTPDVDNRVAAGNEPSVERLLDSLVGAVELAATTFHLGQYCGNWRASTAGHARASFHLVLRGACFLHIAGRAPIPLDQGDAFFLLRDVPHSLTPHEDPDAICSKRPMRPMQPALAGSTSLACGFFEFRGRLSQTLEAALPDYRLLRSQNSELQAVGPLFRLILEEADHGSVRASPLVERLVQLLLFYLIRDGIQVNRIDERLLALERYPQFTQLIEQLMDDPAHEWTVADMARVVHMSRAGFARHFREAAQQPPAQFLRALRMNIAAQRLRRGDNVLRAAEHVGYHSQAAFSRAFAKTHGEQPGMYRKLRAVTVGARGTS